ncbi:farnesol dehydrogenase-like [Teleopsis dalmanni]|uniref:farnesol dehydrogenase-like n=1 Tax=Teleopsis dalmanni TaxID=139649 RepID=UPI000D32AB3A|nr:farnesol dehydrogenase-like [Teleopsis dalmanni]
MERWENCVAVVTGVSSGIGSVIAKDLVTAGMIVVALARRKERVDALRESLSPELKRNFHSIRCDVSDMNMINKVFDWIENKLGGVDVLINNAATLTGGQIMTLDTAILQQSVQTNIMGLVQCSKRAFKSMQERNIAGHIVNINSISGHRVLRLPCDHVLNMYPVTKYGVTALTEVLRQEFRDLGTQIKITSISPGLCDTEMVQDALRELAMLKPEDVSNAILYTLSTPPHVQVHEIIIKPIGETI